MNEPDWSPVDVLISVEDMAGSSTSIMPPEIDAFMPTASSGLTIMQEDLYRDVVVRNRLIRISCI